MITRTPRAGRQMSPSPHIILKINGSLYARVFVCVLSSLALSTLTAELVPSAVDAATLNGTPGNDSLDGTEFSDTIRGYGGNDLINGSSGIDRLYGGLGDDRIYGGAGDDYLYGWRGSNYLNGGSGSDTILATGLDEETAEKNYVNAGPGNDRIQIFQASATVYGYAGADTITVGGEIETSDFAVYGGGGQDIAHNFGDAVVYGGEDNDRLVDHNNGNLHGEQGNDILISNGSDTTYMTGGPGADQFRCTSGNEVISDYTPTEGDSLSGDCDDIKNGGDNSNSDAEPIRFEITPTSVRVGDTVEITGSLVLSDEIARDLPSYQEDGVNYLLDSLQVTELDNSSQSQDGQALSSPVTYVRVRDDLTFNGTWTAQALDGEQDEELEIVGEIFGNRSQVHRITVDVDETEISGSADATITHLSGGALGANTPQLTHSGNNVYAAWVEQGGGGILFARSTDDGETFSSPVTIGERRGGEDFFVQSPDIAASGDAVYVGWEEYDTSGSADQGAVVFRASTDAGSTFGEPVLLSEHDGEGLDIQIVAGETGNVFVTWIDGAFEEFAGRVVLRTSSDYGATFGGETEIRSDGGGGWSDRKQMISSGANSSSDDDAYIAWQEYDDRDYPSATASSVFFASISGGQVSEPVGLNIGEWAMIQHITADSAVETIVYALWKERGEQLDAFGNPGDILLLAKSTDGGESFADPVELADNPGGIFDAQIAASGDLVYVTFRESSEVSPGETSDRGVVLRSTDGGNSFERIDNDQLTGTGEESDVGTGRVLAAFAGNVPMLALNDIVFSESGDILFLRGSGSDDQSDEEDFFDAPLQLTANGASRISEVEAAWNNAFIIWVGPANDGQDVYIASLAFANEDDASPIAGGE